MTNASLAQTFAREIHRIRERDVPEDAADYSSSLLLDYCGNALAGAATESFCLASSGLKHIPDGPYSVVRGRSLAVPEYAALLNGVAGHSLETDDIQNHSSIHIGVVVLPAVIAAAEVRDATGEEFLRAIIAGYEVTGRIGRAVNPAIQYERGFHPTATCGPYGASAAASYLMGLSEEETANALGIASIGSGGLLQFLDDGSLIKRLHPGWAAHSGLTATFLAKAGYTAPQHIFEGRNGFFLAYGDDAHIEEASGPWDPLGDALLDTAIKPHATCRYNQSPVDGVLQVVMQHDLTAEDIDEIQIDVMSVAWNIVADPIDRKRDPKSVVDAQFSLPYAVAVAALYRSAGVAEHRDEIIGRPEVRALMRRVRCVRDPGLDADYPARWPARVQVRTKDGRSYSASVDHPKGDPKNRMAWDETVAKFRAMTEGLATPVCDEIIETVRDLVNLKSTTHLGRLLSEASAE